MADLDLKAFARRIEQAGLDASLWPEVLTELSERVGAKGAVLVSTERYMPGVPTSSAVREMMDDYFRNWTAHDVRAERGLPFVLARGVTTEQDFTTPDEMRRLPYYQDWVERHGCRHFAGVGVRVGGELWCLSIQREASKGQFEAATIKQLAALCRPLGEAATLARTLGFRQVLGIAQAFDLVSEAAMLLDEAGVLLAVNDQASVLLGSALVPRAGSLVCADARSQASFSELVAEALNPDRLAGPVFFPVAIRLRGGRRVHVRAIALRDWARFSFASAKALLLFRAEGAAAASGAHGFRLTPAESRLAEALASGKSLHAAAEALEITYETGRSYLKSIFAKTDTRRQGELVARLLGEKVLR